VNDVGFHDYHLHILDAISKPTVDFVQSQAATVLKRLIAGLRFIIDDTSPDDRRMVDFFYRQVIDAMTVLSVNASTQVDALLIARSRVRTTRTTIMDHRLVSRASEPFTEFAHVEAAVTSLGYNIPNTHKDWDDLKDRIHEDLTNICKVCEFHCYFEWSFDTNRLAMHVAPSLCLGEASLSNSVSGRSTPTWLEFTSGRSLVHQRHRDILRPDIRQRIRSLANSAFRTCT
jgi:hypothetical protein